MKKIFMLMFCVVMAFALAGCGGSDEKNAAQTSSGKVLKVATDANFHPLNIIRSKARCIQVLILPW